jgi:phosphopantothenoylcysteine decarboxylase / phosphopantothenate---cysteine ligase
MSRRLLITAGPTHEPIDAVRYLGNRSSGRLGVALAERAADRGWDTTLLLGPTHLGPPTAQRDTPLTVERFRTASDLGALLGKRLPDADVLVMAAAVADYRPVPPEGVDRVDEVKIRRTGERLTLELEPTPDLLARCSEVARPEQLLVGFALEPAEELMDSSRRKLGRKKIDLIVANPLETMDAGSIEATLVGPAGVVAATAGSIGKGSFADWLLDRLDEHPKVRERRSGSVSTTER